MNGANGKTEKLHPLFSVQVKDKFIKIMNYRSIASIYCLTTVQKVGLKFEESNLKYLGSTLSPRMRKER